MSCSGGISGAKEYLKSLSERARLDVPVDEGESNGDEDEVQK